MIPVQTPEIIMKTHHTALFALLLATLILALPLHATSDDGATNDSENARIRALEAELAALRAQLRAESGMRNEDRGRDRTMAERRERERRAQEAERREHERREHERRMHEHEEHDDRGHREHHVMHLDLREMTGGALQGEVHIELDGSMDAMPGFLPELIMRQMDGHLGGMDHHDPHHEELMHEQEMLEALHMHVVSIMEEHGMPMALLEEAHMAVEEDGVHPLEAVHLLIDRLSEEGIDPSPLIELMEEVHDDHDGGHHGEDPFFEQGGEFVAKMELANKIGTSLSDPLDVAIFGVWEARQHLEPEERLQVLGPIMGDENIDMSVRNAAAMVVREAFYQLGDREKALETLHLQIRLNGTVR
ncbi:MAG TPA: hypothetical protein DEO57_01675 [Phycisphaerales bacterium]|nr:hypothetical protein [Phycisphaerales bacterium]